jgi:hypothetical protein
LKAATDKLYPNKTLKALQDGKDKKVKVISLKTNAVGE